MGQVVHAEEKFLARWEAAEKHRELHGKIEKPREMTPLEARIYLDAQKLKKELPDGTT